MPNATTPLIATETGLTVSGVETVDAEIVEPARTIGDEIADGLIAVAALMRARPDLAETFQYQVSRWLVPAQTRDRVATYARAGARLGAEVSKHQDDDWAGVDLAFGRVKLHVYVAREEICERIVTGTHKVTEEVPDPEKLAAVPKVSQTRTEEIIEWRCHPILAAELPAGGAA